MFYGNSMCFTCKTDDIPILNVREAAACETRLVLSAVQRCLIGEDLKSLAETNEKVLKKILEHVCTSLSDSIDVPPEEESLSHAEMKELEIPQLRRQVARIEYFIRTRRPTSMGSLKKLKFNRNIVYETLLANEIADTDEFDSLLDYEKHMPPDAFRRKKESIMRARARFGDSWESEDEADIFYQSVPSYSHMRALKSQSGPGSIDTLDSLSVSHEDDVLESGDAHMTAFHTIVPGIGFYCPVCPPEYLVLYDQKIKLKDHIREMHQGKRLPDDVLKILKWIQCNRFGCAKFIFKNECCADCLKRHGGVEEGTVSVSVEDESEMPALTSSATPSSARVSDNISEPEPSSKVVMTPTVTPTVTSTVTPTVTPTADSVGTTSATATTPTRAPEPELITLRVTPIGANNSTSASASASASNSGGNERAALSLDSNLAAAVERQEVDRLFTELSEPAKMALFHGYTLYNRVVGVYGPALKRIEAYRRDILESFHNKFIFDALKPKVRMLIAHLKNLKMNTDYLKVVPLMDAILLAGCPLHRLGLPQDWPWVKSLPYCQAECIDETFLSNSEQIILRDITPAFQYIQSLVASINTEQSRLESECATVDNTRTAATDAPFDTVFDEVPVVYLPVKRTPSARELELIKRRDEGLRTKEFFAQFDFSKFPSYVIEVQIPRTKDCEEAEFKATNKGELTLEIQVYFTSAATMDGRAKLVIPHVGSKVQSIKNMVWTSLGINLPNVDQFVALNTVNYGVRLQASRSFAYYNIGSGSVVRIKPVEFFKASVETAKQRAAAARARPLSARETRRQEFWKRLREEQLSDPERMQWEAENFGFLSQNRGVCRWVLTENGWTDRHERAARARVLGEIMPEGYSTKAKKKAKRRTSAISSSSSEGSDDDWVDLDELPGNNENAVAATGAAVEGMGSPVTAFIDTAAHRDEAADGARVLRPPSEHRVPRPDALPNLSIQRIPDSIALPGHKDATAEPPTTLSSLSGASAVQPPVVQSVAAVPAAIDPSISRQHDNDHNRPSDRIASNQQNRVRSPPQRNPPPRPSVPRPSAPDRRPSPSPNRNSKPGKKGGRGGRRNSNSDDDDDEDSDAEMLAAVSKRFKPYNS